MVDLLSTNIADSASITRGSVRAMQATFLGVHVILLVLASTDFTVVTAPLGLVGALFKNTSSFN